MKISCLLEKWHTPSMIFLTALGGFSLPAQAHFLELIPETELISANAGPDLSFSLKFNHPAAGGPLMDLAVETFGVKIIEPGATPVTQDLRATLKEKKLDGKRHYNATYQVKSPGNFVFFAQQKPYWEAEESVWIQQSGKVIVDAYDALDGWQHSVGFDAEISPLTRPYGLWSGQSFTAVVMHYGKPAPFVSVEVEYRHDGGQIYPGEAFVTQQVMTDKNGVFQIGLPKAGWWGFAALMESKQKMKSPSGEDAPLEQGAVLWVRTRDMP